MNFLMSLSSKSGSTMFLKRAYSSITSVSGARGSGGRSSYSGITATVFGATGFLGRYVVNQLGKIGSQVIVPWRGDELDYRHLKLMGDLGQIVPMEFDLRDKDSLYSAMEGSNVVINLIGKTHTTRYFNFYDMHTKGAEDIAKVAKHSGVDHLIHVSCANPNVNSTNPWIKSKALGEEAVLNAFPSATIIRPTDMFGSEDKFTRKYAWGLKMLPVMPVTNGGQFLVQPVYVDDVATVIRNAAKDPEYYAGKICVLGGPSVHTMSEVLDWMMKVTGKKRVKVPIPGPLAVFVMSVAGQRVPIFNISPKYTATEVMRDLSDDIVKVGSSSNVALFKDLDIVPVGLMSDIGAEILLPFREGGERSALFHVGEGELKKM